VNFLQHFRERLPLGPASLAFFSGSLLKWQFPLNAASEALAGWLRLLGGNISAPAVVLVRR